MPESATSPAALGRERLRARARRISKLRKRVVAASLATFVLAFGVIAYDGSMGSTTSTETAAVASTSTSSTDTGSTSSSDETSSAVTRQS